MWPLSSLDLSRISYDLSLCSPGLSLCSPVAASSPAPTQHYSKATGSDSVEEEKQSEGKKRKAQGGKRKSIVDEIKAFENAVICIQRAWRGHEGKRKFDRYVLMVLMRKV